MTRGTTTRRGVLKGAAAGSVILAAPAVVGQAAAQGKKVSYIAPFAYQMSFAPELNAVAGGHHARHGLDVEMLPGRGAAMAVQQVVAGRALFTRTSGIEIALSVDKGVDLVGIATMVQSSNFFVVSAQDKPIRNAKEMPGKTIGIVSVRGSTENTLDMMLAKNNIPIEQVKRQPVGNAPSAFALVAQGRIDAMIVSLPTVTLLRESGEKILAWNTDQEAKQPGQVYLCLKSTIEKDPDVCLRFVRGIRDSARELLAADTPAKREAIVKRLGEKFPIEGLTNPAAAAKTIEDEEPLWFSEGKENLLRNVPSRWQALIDNMNAAKQLERKIAATDLYTNRFVEEALRS
ncbi:MAG: ABC transporter substrate-binding protein [Alphaproteobacteria bacterium]|nr:ABC transporter substrate-binding protein [Alphaproteobacteria bacterium]